MTPAERARRLLKWYPPAWRERYGEEFAALLDDTAGDAAPSVRLRLDVVRSGVAMRLREAGLSGRDTPPAGWIRGGALLVLCAWSVFVVAGIGLQKTAEHWQDAVPSGAARTWAEIAFGAVQALAGIASLLVVAGAVAVLPAVARSLRSGGWPAVRRSFVRAAIICGVTVTAFIGLAVWAGRLTDAQRNGSDLAYGLGALLFALLVCASIASVTAAAVATVRRLSLPPAVLRLEGHLAEAVTVAIIVMSVAAGVWWAVVAATSPRFFTAGGSPFQPQTAVVAALMLSAVALSVTGARRVIQGSRRTA